MLHLEIIDDNSGTAIDWRVYQALLQVGDNQGTIVTVDKREGFVRGKKGIVRGTSMGNMLDAGALVPLSAAKAEWNRSLSSACHVRRAAKKAASPAPARVAAPARRIEVGPALGAWMFN